jgi:hypothetical protein
MRLLPSLLALGSALPAIAQEAPSQVQPKRGLSVVTADWNDDGSFDRALPVEVGTDLPILPSDDGMMASAVYRRGLGRSGAVRGTQPELGLTERGSLTITSRNDAIGREGWQETLTLPYREGGFVVSGDTFEGHDTHDPATRCDVNLLTRKGFRNGAPFTTPTSAVPIEEWTDGARREGCP